MTTNNRLSSLELTISNIFSEIIYEPIEFTTISITKFEKNMLSSLKTRINNKTGNSFSMSDIFTFIMRYIDKKYRITEIKELLDQIFDFSTIGILLTSGFIKKLELGLEHNIRMINTYLPKKEKAKWLSKYGDSKILIRNIFLMNVQYILLYQIDELIEMINTNQIIINNKDILKKILLNYVEQYELYTKILKIRTILYENKTK